MSCHPRVGIMGGVSFEGQGTPERFAASMWTHMSTALIMKNSATLHFWSFGSLSLFSTRSTEENHHVTSWMSWSDFGMFWDIMFLIFSNGCWRFFQQWLGMSQFRPSPHFLLALDLGGFGDPPLSLVKIPSIAKTDQYEPRVWSYVIIINYCIYIYIYVYIYICIYYAI